MTTPTGRRALLQLEAIEQVRDAAYDALWARADSEDLTKAVAQAVEDYWNEQDGVVDDGAVMS